MTKPKVSIIVPIYNIEKYLPKCINSILGQSFTDFELILVNDGSLDNCGKICDKFAEKDSRIKVIHKDNKGLSSARNIGIRHAKGDFIGFIDGDDFIHKSMYETLYKTANLHLSDIVVCDVTEVPENGNSESMMCKEISESKIQHFTKIEALNQLYQPKEGTFDPMGRGSERWIYAVNKLYKRSLFDSLKFKEGRIYEDEFIVHKIYFKCKKITSINTPLYFYVQRPNSIINSRYSVNRFDRVYALKERSDFFKKVNEENLHEKAYKCYIETLLWNYQAAMTQLDNVSKELESLKNTLSENTNTLLKNPYINWKQKVMIILFIISPSIYFYVSLSRDNRFSKAT